LRNASVVRIYLGRMPQLDLISAYVEAEDPEEAFRRLVALEKPFRRQEGKIEP
jgi:hypothetical protein